MAKRPLALNYQTKCGLPRTLDDVATDRAGQQQQQQQQQQQHGSNTKSTAAIRTCC